jgi:hypothetical protein
MSSNQVFCAFNIIYHSFGRHFLIRLMIRFRQSIRTKSIPKNSTLPLTFEGGTFILLIIRVMDNSLLLRRVRALSFSSTTLVIFPRVLKGIVESSC